ncbi:D-alanyl-D-alanine dipeptidase [Moritella sp. JT01]|uniref:M15 family metallopeptidase n=1 Tax=Moritella sp. JT01 TaxID=756698 RepID=UPI0007934FFA|nr:M15 family metallopeptidase [Moritella sp. JT01]KXO10174.1 D-alanyl-D-alanine dipeptidase [Moritella sp. JT01]
MTNIIFEQIPIQENGEPLLCLAELGFILEPAYFNMGLSDDPNLYAREGVVKKLIQISNRLGEYRFKIWDPWRSREVQNNIYQKYWSELSTEHPEWDEDQLKDEVGKFVTVPDNPERVPPHATGGSVDLTLVDLDGNELDMGTCFDHFGAEAATLYYEEDGRDIAIRDNRRLLRQAMESAGFRSDEDEWWHFDYGNQLWAAQFGHDFAIYGEK